MTVLVVVAAGATTPAGAHAQAPGSNLLSAMNPSFELAHDGWRFSHEAMSTQAWAYEGAGPSSMRVTGSTTNGEVFAYSSFVPVVAGTTYSGRIAGKVETALQGGMRLQVEWWNDGSQVGTDTGTPATGAGGVVLTASVTAVAPAGATQARLRAFDSGTGTWDVHLDAAMLVEGGVPGAFYAEPPPNLLSDANPSFERALDDWSFSHPQSASSSTAWVYDGNGVSSAHMTGSVSNGEVSAYSSLVAVAAGTTYSGRITGRLDSSPQGGFRLEIEWWNDSARIGGAMGSRAAGAETTASVTGVAPAGTTRARLRAFDGGSGLVDVHLDAAMLVEGGVPSHYYAAVERLTVLEDLPAPALGRKVNVAPVPGSGPVLIEVDGTFVPLSEAEQIQVGSVIDTTRGAVELVTATGAGSGTQSGTFSQGVFQVLQSRARRAKGLTDIRLKGGNFNRCRTGKRGRAGAAQVSRRTIRRTRSNTSGRYRTVTQNSAGTTRGTVWITADRCDGTLTTVKRGKVAVRDFRRKKTIIVRAGKSYLARPGG
jgi:hypothetical protein